MIIQLDKKKQDIALLCISALLIFIFPYSIIGLFLAVACICGIIVTEPWYKNRIEKIDNWCAKHRLFTIIYSCLLGAFFVPNFCWNMTVFHAIIAIAIICCGLIKKLSCLPRLITYNFFLFLVLIFVIGFTEASFVPFSLMFISLLLSGYVMFTKLYRDKK